MGIKYCCGGNLSLPEVCQLQHLDQSAIGQDIEQAQRTILLSSTVAFDSWPVDFLTDYVVHVHHATFQQTVPLLEERFAQFVQGHQKRYPHLADMHGLLKKLISMLDQQA